ncbi:MAG TPA: DUF1800 domain-containing protein [Candidatus Rubrimentiphilum sp.]|nr:DUF1800 domain-containing protein [Candidatus Rubrimentiphilum sp.]
MATALTPRTDVAGIYRPAGQLDAATALAPYKGAWNSRLAAHLLRRAGFGSSPDEAAKYASMDVHSAVDALIDFPSTDGLPAPDELYDPRAALMQYLQPGMRPAALDDMTKRKIGQDVRRHERQSIIALQRWWLNRMLATPAPLQEKMALYFHGHFTSAAIQKGVSPIMVFNQNQLFRANALGNLRDLTWQVSIDPAMMIYLDNARSDPQHSNENYARELMELFTLGVGNYTEQDVRESARAWTGWVLRPRDGTVQFVPFRHDNGSKTFLGETGNFAGRDIVNIIFKQPASAAFFANSLLNFFVYNGPEPQLVDAVARLIRKNDFNIKPVISTLLRSNVFYSSRAYRALVKSPVEFVIGAYKALGAKQVDDSAQRALVQMGQILFYPPNVAGWPGGANWLTSQTVIARENFLAAIVNSPMMDGVDWMQKMPLKASQAAKDLVAAVLYGDASEQGVAQLTDYLNGAGTSALGMLSGENYPERIRGAAYLTMAMPAYQLN